MLLLLLLLLPWPAAAAAAAAALPSHLLLCAVCLGSALQTFQINRGAAAGFLLQAITSMVEAGALLAILLGLSSGSTGPPVPEVSWVSTVAGLPLLVFGFHWLNGDCATANTLLGGALVLTGGWGYFSDEGKAMVVHSVTAVSSITILIISIFTGNPWGMAGALLVAFCGLVSETKSHWTLLVALRERDIMCWLMAAANYSLRRALQMQQQELDLEHAELFAAVYE